MHRLLHGLRHALAAPSRTPRTAVVIGRLLAIAFLLCFGTGLYSHFIQDPLPWMVFPNRPFFLYQVTQGIHITAGILCFPLLFAKLYAVFPELFQYPPVKSLPNLLERASIAVFVASSLVQITIGLLNTYQWYALFPFPFRQTHYALSFVIIGSLAIHIAVKLPVIARYWRKRDSYDADGEFIDDPAVRHHDDEAPLVEPVETPVDAPVAASVTPDADIVVSTGSTSGGGSTSRGGSSGGGGRAGSAGGVTGALFAWIDRTPPVSPTVSRRGFVAAVTAASAVLVALTAGQSFRLFDATNLFAPRKNGVGPNALPINRTAKAAKVLETATDPGWALSVTNGDMTRSFDLAALRALPQYEVDLPIACVEGWSQMATWRGPRLRDIADTVGADPDATIRAVSLEKDSSYAMTDVPSNFARDELTLVALELNGEVLDIDHGYPARLIAPARPGVLQTKWLSSLEARS